MQSRPLAYGKEKEHDDCGDAETHDPGGIPFPGPPGPGREADDHVMVGVPPRQVVSRDSRGPTG
ncbi:hypothetical protein GCM10010145_60980 [Streptomyces ruber]|uniref:Uncharacterized protein n=2 Tax=Streptomyces TaxID=1883 RepID=A0A918BRJ5_9ACTN|nr:hypothetical protein GCM10010145_60980 [Streptomyces ruber]